MIIKKPITGSVDGDIPIRALVKCHCETALTGAHLPRGKSGKYFHHYKYKHLKKIYISTIKAHEWFLNTCDLNECSRKKIQQKTPAVILVFFC